MNKKYFKSILLVLGLLSFLVNGDNYAASPLLLNISRDLNVNIDTAALSVSSYMLFFGLLTIIIGPLGDRYGKSKIIIISALGTSIFSLLCVFSNNIQSLIIFRAINGGFASGILPVSVALIGEMAPKDQKQNSIAKVMSMMFFGGAIATTVGGGLAFLGSWKLVYGVYGLMELILALLAFIYLGKVKDAGSKVNIVSLYKIALSNRSLRIMLLNLFFMGYCILGTFVYAGKLVENKTGLNVFMIGIILSLFGIGSIVAGRKSVSIRLKLGNIYFLVAGLIGCISVLALVGFSSIWSISFSMLLFGAVFIALQSSFVSTAQSILPDMRGTVMALASFSVVIGGSLGTYLNGKFLNSVGLNYVFIISAILLFAIGLLATISNKQIKIIS